MLIVDAQIHLWKAESDDWKWVPGAVPQLPVPFTIERAKYHRVEGSAHELVVRARGLDRARKHFVNHFCIGLSHEQPSL